MKKWLKHIMDAFIKSVFYSSSIGFAVFVGVGLFSWDWESALYLGAGIWLVFWMVMFFGELLNGKPIVCEKNE